MLIDTRDQPPEPERDGDGDGRWLGALLDWLFPWPAILIWLFIGAMVLEGLAGAGCAVAVMLLTFWRLSKAYPGDGLRSHSQ